MSKKSFRMKILGGLFISLMILRLKTNGLYLIREEIWTKK
jgi:hypothetical protein